MTPDPYFLSDEAFDAWVEGCRRLDLPIKGLLASKVLTVPEVVAFYQDAVAAMERTLADRS